MKNTLPVVVIIMSFLAFASLAALFYLRQTAFAPPSTMMLPEAACDITPLHETVQACSRECLRAAVKLHCPGAP